MGGAELASWNGERPRGTSGVLHAIAPGRAIAAQGGPHPAQWEHRCLGNPRSEVPFADAPDPSTADAVDLVPGLVNDLYQRAYKQPLAK
jgi:hypothetical protein